MVLSPERSDELSWDAMELNIPPATTPNCSSYRASSNMFEMEELDAQWTRAVAAHRALEVQAGIPTPLSRDELLKSTADIERVRFWATFDE